MKKRTSSRIYRLLLSLIVLLPACGTSPLPLATLAPTAAPPSLGTPTDGERAPAAGTAIIDAIAEPTQQPLSPEDAESTAAAATAVAYAAFVATQGTPLPTVPPTTTPPPTTAPPAQYTYRIVNTFPHDPEAFTQGLVYHDGVFYEGTGLWGESTLREVAIETGSVIRSHALEPQFFGEGITLLNDKIYQLTWQEQTGFVYDRETFRELLTFNYPTEGWGITHDGQKLIVSDGSSTLYFWDPGTLQEIGRITVRDDQGQLNRLNELEYIDGEIWANIWMTNLIARISPETGDVLGYVDLTGLLDTSGLAQPVDVLNGIAYDPQTGHIFVTGKLWPSVFEIEVIPVS